MSNSPLVSYVNLSPNCSSRNGAKIDRITPHHMAGNLSIETCGNVFAPSSRQASSNYGIGSDGRIGLYVEESMRAWTSSSYANDRRAVTIEVANSSIGGDWPVSDAAWKSLVNLCVDICKRNGIPGLTWTGSTLGSITTHDMFKRTNCPGPHLKSRMNQLADEVNARLRGETTSSEPEMITAPKADPSKHSIMLQANTNNGIYPIVKDNEDNAGDGTPIRYLSAWTTPGVLTVQARTSRNGWLPELRNPARITDRIHGAVGDGFDMTGLSMYYNAPNRDKAVHYRVMTSTGWLPWMIDHHDTGGSNDHFAGNGSPILRVEAFIGDL